MAARHRFNPSTEETEPLYSSEMQEQVGKAWDAFVDPPREPTVGSEVKRTYIEFGTKFLKVFTMIVVFCIVLGAAIVSKGTMLFMTSQIRKNVTRAYCNADLNRNMQFVVSLPLIERVQWIWMLMFAYFVPEFGTWFRSTRKCLFKHWKFPSFFEILSLCITELCPAVGSAILIFVILPELDVIKGAMLTNAMCFVPAIVAMFSRNPCNLNDDLKMCLDIICIIAQASSFVIWPLIEDNPTLYLIPVSVILISLGWWENFVSESSQLPFIRNLALMKKEFDTRTYFIYIFVAPLKCLFFLCTVLVIYKLQEDDISFLFDSFSEAFQDRTINAIPIVPILPSDLENAVQSGTPAIISVYYSSALWVWLINISATYICYAFGKFSCKVMIQEIGFAFPLNLSVPVLLSGLIAMCGMYYRDECSFSDTIPNYLFFNLPPLLFLEDFVSQQYAWIWLIWLLSQAWISVHIWSPNCDKLASTEQLFIRPMYDAFLVDQSLALNRRRHEHKRHDAEDENRPEISDLDYEDLTENKDSVTRIYACGTMWHETDEEMKEFLKSIMRLDQDQCAHRLVREILHLKHENYYELETHIFFDDAFVRISKNDNDPHVNEYVEKLALIIDDAASKVHKTNVRIRPPKIYPTPYGGRLVWTLPGKTKMIAHLKDKAKIRAKKRWSQCMYMYYLLGFRLQANDELSLESKEIRAENTFILALDGDIDFQPEALHLLVDYMKKNRTLGAACGRIHPVGSGGMVWYQMFEYAVGHWLQKATEHVIGCVLCSPGCFSLFRGKALMDKSVMKKYTTRSTQAKHYVQYDQGEDRWLCTLLLQRGYRVEYSAASDAFTHCPEGFNEFYNQRRRWMPSTMANILDLLMDYEHTVKINENISMLYVFYQVILLIGTVIGPGTIFLMLVGAFVAAFGLDQWSSFLWNLVPILIFVVVCATCSSDVQLFFAGLISAIYGLIMMAVFVGVMLQINEDGFLAPSSLFFFCVAAEFIIAAGLHPMEINCLKYGVVYYVTVPSMYMLLVIYSVFNMNNVSWGTREVTIVPKDQNNDKKEEKKEEKKVETKDKILTFLGANAEDNEGALEFSLNKLFKCMFCTYKSEKNENEDLRKIQETLKSLDKKIEALDKKSQPEFPQSPAFNNTTFMEGSKATLKNNPPDNTSDNSQPEVNSLPSDEVMENSWFYDGPLIRGEVHYLNRKEETFWNELIEEYLHPIEDDKDKVSNDLKDLRDKMVFTFFMLNSLFVLVVFLLTLKKDLLHLNWPIDPKVNFTYNEDMNEVAVYITYLQLEPIGFVFLIFFALLMVIQFFAMLIHRFGTFQQVLTKTHLDFNLFNKSVEDMSADELKSTDPLKLVADLQKLKGINNELEDEHEVPVDKRKTQNNLIQPGERSSNKPIYHLDEAFHRRLTQHANGEPVGRVSEFRKKSVAFVQRRMSRAPGRQSQARRPTVSYGNNTEVLHLDEQNIPDTSA